MDLGFATRAGAVVKVETVANEYTYEQRLAFVDEMARRLDANAQIEAHGVTARMPLDLGTMIFAVDVPGVEPPPGQNRHRPEATPITPGYFEAMGIAFVEGRDFDASDDETNQDVIIISREAAERWWPRESAIGKVVYRNGDTEDPQVVVGVVGNVKIWSLGEPPRAYVYWPFQQGGANDSFYITARGNMPPGELAAFIRGEARSIDPDIFLTSVGTMDDHLAYIYFLPRMAAAMLSLVGALALLLACIGLYGMVSYGVSRRTREMGIRLALGADGQSVVRLVLKGGLALVAVGGVAGIAVSLGLGGLVERFLVGVDGVDLLALLAAPAVLVLVAVTATYVPARRASKVDPVQALRTD
jgi:predicted permease